MDDGRPAQNALLGMISEPSAFLTNFMNSIPPMRYAHSKVNTLKKKKVLIIIYDIAAGSEIY